MSALSMATMHEENQQRFYELSGRLTTIEHRLGVLMKTISVVVGCDNLEADNSLQCIIEFREQHRRLMFYDRQFNSLTESVGKWVIRGMVAFIMASSFWALSNFEIIRKLWEK